MATGQKIAGVDVLVKVGATPEVVGGQSGAELSRSMNVIETTDKTSNGWVTKIGGTKEWSIELEAFMVVGDTGFSAMNTAFANREEVDVEMEVGGILFKGKALISDFPLSAPQDDAVTFSITLEGTGELVESTPVA
jgi:TP901-1 family phage major tail protein